MLGIEKKLSAFQNKLIEKAGTLHAETMKLQQQGNSLKQEDAVRLAQMTIRALVLLDIADIIAALIKE